MSPSVPASVPCGCGEVPNEGSPAFLVRRHGSRLGGIACSSRGLGCLSRHARAPAFGAGRRRIPSRTGVTRAPTAPSRTSASRAARGRGQLTGNALGRPGKRAVARVGLRHACAPTRPRRHGAQWATAREPPRSVDALLRAQPGGGRPAPRPGDLPRAHRKPDRRAQLRQPLAGRFDSSSATHAGRALDARAPAVDVDGAGRAHVAGERAAGSSTTCISIRASSSSASAATTIRHRGGTGPTHLDG